VTDLTGVRRARCGLLAVFALAAFAASPPTARGAEFGIAPGGFSVRTIDAEGNPTNLAGAHPDRFQIEFALNVEDTTVRDLEFDLPAGLGTDPSAVPPCPRDLFDKGEEECPPESQVGVLGFGPPESEMTLPIFVVEPLPDEIAAFGSIPGVDLPMTMEFRPGDFGITMKANDLPQGSLAQGRVELWGVPADRQEGTAIPRLPFLTTPTRCGPMPVTFRTRSWQEGAPWLTATDAVTLDGCQDLRFAPRLDWQLSNPVVDSPTGFRVDLSMPEDRDPNGRASAQIVSTVVQFPAGFTVSPAGAAGLSACSDSQLGLGQTTEAACPPSSRVGSVEFASPALREPLDGVVYLGEERAGEPFRLFIVASGPGMVLKFAGSMRTDPATGRLSMAMNDLPEVAVARLTLSMDGGPRALLASPLECGPSNLVAKLQPSNGGVPVEASTSVSIAANAPSSTCPGPGPFAPTLEVVRSTTRAGRPTAFSMRLLRRPGEQLPGRFSMTLPPGLNAAIGALEPCPDSATASGECPSESRVGGAVVEVGSGSDPVALHGDAYLTGPYRKAPFGLLMVFRVALGPFDFGTMALRAALQVDRDSGRVTMVTDRLPTVFEGVPARFRTVGLSMDRRGFLSNPTSCAPTAVEARIEAAGGSVVTARSPFGARGCNRLGFKPRVSMAFVGRSELHRSGHPGLRVAARFRHGDANLRVLSLSFPPILTFNFSAVEEICARRDAIEGDCPIGSRVGTAYTWSPVLGERLKGSMHIVQPTGDGLPDLWFGIASKGVRISMKGETLVRDGQFAVRLAGLPDLGLSAFTMRTPQGEEGIFSLSEGLCVAGAPRRIVAPTVLKGQNGIQRRLRVRVRARPRCTS
jgi:hypothetical protein